MDTSFTDSDAGLEELKGFIWIMPILSVLLKEKNAGSRGTTMEIVRLLSIWTAAAMVGLSVGFS